MNLVHHQPDNFEKQAAAQALEKEIAALENALNDAETKLNVFTAQIRNQLAPQIQRLQVLVMRYKKLKQDKKEKRLEQKKKGKHYQAPPTVPVYKNASEITSKTQAPEDLKRLYKEAIVLVHPDKVGAENAGLTQQANALTAELNALFERGDLEELKGFHAHILSGLAFSHARFAQIKSANSEAQLSYLQTKRDNLKKALEDLQASELFFVLQTYADPLTFIPELRQQFEARIAVFEKRTRKYKE